MFNDEDGLGFGILGLGVVGEVMLILFVTVVFTTSVTNMRLLHDQVSESSPEEDAPVIGLGITMGPGTSIWVDGKETDLDTVLSRAEKVPEGKKIQVQMHTSGDPKLFWKLRYELKKLKRGYVEAPPVGVAVNVDGRK